jgi:hypothetical protein
MVDPVFKLAYLQELKPWRKKQEMLKQQQRQDAARRARAEAEKRKQEQRDADEREKIAQKERARLAAAEERREAQERRKFHAELDNTLSNLDRSDARVAQTNFALKELMTDIKWWLDNARRACIGQDRNAALART